MSLVSNQILDPTTGLVVPPPRIVNGYDVSPAFKYPTFVSIQRSGFHDCGGTLWNGNTIITAAHCSQNDVSVNTVKVHRHDLAKTDKQEKGKTYKVLSHTVHPKYTTTNNGYDVAIWKIDAPAGKRTAIELDDGKVGNKVDTLLTAIGWGSTGSGPAKTILQEVKLPIFDFPTCQKDYINANLNMTNADTQLCAGFPEGGKDTCQGDSGGPLFTIQGKKTILVGLTSYGIGCARPNLPGVYTRVSAVKDWILKNI
ncbi:putative trypsin-like serine protease precursor [Conidiobolus coronatus NRRL 28638]|uniref:Putative trypsin-like serine protease n=1 Tax=Conidiobolus coronatus (strain ATCC 28846 / CBS 209.66 / NRRL 28638) TaxID=796925 RepID=A0A137P4M0_CONC2|nr:putative trypsin-like serine protease precursor [Conidiobolus coronatus NRRL 28638]|eukprot:KXN69889.1 putative trypsin-like serine protease precursor [Conidiobolus coronatus NRRL 28638]